MLYHREVKWLDHFDDECLNLLVSTRRLSKHLYNHIKYSNDRSHKLTLRGIYTALNRIQTYDYIEPFEVKTDENNHVIKFVVRTYYNKYNDICLVITKDIVVTAWLCNYKDNHRTLNKNKYEN